MRQDSKDAVRCRKKNRYPVKVKCGQGQCRSELQLRSSFVRHLVQVHSFRLEQVSGLVLSVEEIEVQCFESVEESVRGKVDAGFGSIGGGSGEPVY